MTGEFAFIEALRGLPLHPGARGLRDDAATLEIGGETLVITQDTLVEGVHVLPDWPDAADTAWKLVAVNLSDLAAKGAEPVGVMLSHATGGDDERFLHGLREILDRYGVKLLGGDTVATAAPRSYTLTAIGRAMHTPVPSRSGAQPGDGLYLCGMIGDAMAGFEAIERDRSDTAGASAYLRPEPKLDEGIALAPHVSAMMDVSDGLLLDTDRLAKTSGVVCDIDIATVPFASGLTDSQRDNALSWGDDYALLFTAPPGAQLPVPVTKIGEVTASSDHRVTLNGAPLPADAQLGYRHGG